MKRVLLISAAVVGAVCALGAQPVKADPATDASLSQWADQTTNQLVNGLPAPPGWHPRHACLIVDEANKGWCVTFPWPT
jgi:hypothetical protein